jgi:subtilisin family serine protease
MKKYLIITFVIFIILSFILSSLGTAWHSDRTIKSKISRELQTKLAQLDGKEMVKVIIGLKEKTIVKRGIFGLAVRKINAQDSLASEIKNFGGRIKHKYKTIPAVAAKVPANLVEKLAKDPNVKSIGIDKPVRMFLQDSIPLIEADKTWNLQVDGINITGKGESVCVIDTGVDYTHPDLGNCSPVKLSLTGDLVNLTPPVESDHPYANNFNYTWNITVENFSHIAVHFVNISLETPGESGYDTTDRIRIYNGNHEIVSVYKGNLSDFWTPSIEGDTIYVNLQTDPSVTYYGFYIDKAINGTTNLTYDWTNCTKIINGWDMVNNDPLPIDDNGHGTHVSGIAGANGTIKGVAIESGLVSIKALDSSGGGWESDILAGIDWCVNRSEDLNISVISMSLGVDCDLYPQYCYSTYCDDNETYYRDAINAAIAKNISVVIATGNDYNYTHISPPACIENATKVTATNKSDNYADFANRGSGFPDILTAPGVNINSTLPGNTYDSWSGTSMSTPHVSGLVALFVQAYEGRYGRRPTPSFVRQRLIETGKKIYDPKADANFSRIDAYEAVDSVIIPYILLESPLNQSYNSSHIDFNITVSKNISSANFSVDSGENQSLLNNTYIHWYNTSYPDLEGGQHNATFFVSDKYGNFNSTIIYFTIDLTDPAASQGTNPTFYYNTSQRSITFELKCSDNHRIDTLQLWGNWSGTWEANKTNSSPSNDSYWNVTVNGIPEGTWKWGVWCNDSAGNEDWSDSNRSFTVDVTPPTLIILFPINKTYNTTSIDLNVSSDGSEDTWWYSLNSGVNTTFEANTTINGIEGPNNITVYVNDSFGNENSSTVFFTIDTTYPILSIVLPENKTYTSTSRTLNYTYIETNVDTCWYEYNSTNTTLPNCTNANFEGLDNQTSTLILYINDSAGNVNSTSVTFTIDTTPPNISNPAINPSIAQPNSNATLISMITDNYAVSYAYVTGYNSSLEMVYQQNLSNAGDNWFIIFNTSFNISNVSTGTYYFNITAVDNAGNNKTVFAGNITINQTSGANATFTNTSVSTSNNQTVINATETTNTVLEIRTNQFVSNALVSIAMYEENPGTANVGISSINKYLEIVATPDINNSLSYVIIKIYYNDSDILSGYSENNLRIYYQNPNGGWTIYDGDLIGGVNTNENYVWANTTHLSIYGVFIKPTCDDGIQNQGEEGVDCGGPCSSCSQPPPGVSMTGISYSPPAKGRITNCPDIVTLNQFETKSFTFTVNNTGETNLTEVKVNYTTNCIECMIKIEPQNVSILKGKSKLFTAYVTSNTTGNFTLWFNLTSKEGVKNSTRINLVVREKPEVEKAICNHNGICEPELGENESVCPKDCRPRVCAQVITSAIAPNGSCSEFSTPCDVPEGWEIVDQCPLEEKGDLSILIVLGLVIVVILVLAFSIITRKTFSKSVRS